MDWTRRTVLLIGSLLFATATLAADAPENDPYEQWLTFKDNFAQVAGGPAGMYSIQDMIVLAPGDTAYLTHAKRSTDARWTKTAPPDNDTLRVAYTNGHALIRGNGIAERDLTQLPEQQLTLPNGQIVRWSRYEGEQRKLWLHDPKLTAQRHFQALAYFPYDPNAVVTARFIRKPNPVAVNHLDSQKRSGLMYWVGDVEVTLAGKPQRLRAFNYQQDWTKTGHVLLFLRDRTSNKTTYGGGRVLEAHFPNDAVPTQLALNFNMLYAFLCAHSEFFNCPVNLTDKVDVALTYGEKYPPVRAGKR